MIDSSREVDFGRLERIIRGEVNIQKEYTAGVGRIVGAHNRRLPVKHVISHRACRTVGRWILA